MSLMFITQDHSNSGRHEHWDCGFQGPSSHHLVHCRCLIMFFSFSLAQQIFTKHILYIRHWDTEGRRHGPYCRLTGVPSHGKGKMSPYITIIKDNTGNRLREVPKIC